jgi:hypothetical protein
VGHEVAGDPVVRVVKQNSHDTPLKHSLATLSPSDDSGRSGISDVSCEVNVGVPTYAGFPSSYRTFWRC